MAPLAALAAAALLLLPGPTGGDPSDHGAAAAADSLALCDRAYADGDVAASARLARDVLQRIADQNDPARAPAAWRLARALIGAGNLEPDRERRRRQFSDALAMAELAARLDPEGTNGHTCAAIAAGSLSSLAGGRERIELAERARASARRAVELDAGNHLAWLVLGVWNREVALIGGLKKAAAGLFYGGVPRGASLAESEACLRRAVALAPDLINPRRELGITLSALRRWPEAAAAFDTAAGLAPRAPADSLYAADARRRLTEIRRRLEQPPDHGLR